MELYMDLIVILIEFKIMNWPQNRKQTVIMIKMVYCLLYICMELYISFRWHPL